MRPFTALMVSILLLIGCATPTDTPPTNNAPPQTEDICERGGSDFSFETLDIPYEDIGATEMSWLGSVARNPFYEDADGPYYAFYMLPEDGGGKFGVYAGGQLELIDEYVGETVRVTGKLGSNADVDTREQPQYDLIIPKSIECATPPPKDPPPPEDPPLPEDVCEGGARNFTFDALDTPYEDIDAPEETWEGVLENNYDYGDPDGTYYAFFIAEDDAEEKLPVYGARLDEFEQELIGLYVGKKVRIIGKFGDNVDLNSREFYRYNLIIPKSLECL